MLKHCDCKMFRKRLIEDFVLTRDGVEKRMGGKKTWKAILKILEKQSEVIKLQTDIIDTLALELLQGGVMTEKDLLKIKEAAMLQKELQS